MRCLILQKELLDILGDRFSESESVRTNYSHGEDIFDPVLPQAVVFPNNNEEISKIVKFFKNYPKLNALTNNNELERKLKRAKI